jgi:predicted SpoU family rRNA methylase
MNTENARVMDVMDAIFIDIFSDDLKDIQEAVYRYGGTIMMYELHDSYRMSYTLHGTPFHLMIYGIHISKEQYDAQVKVFNAQFKDFKKGDKLTLIDNLYFV